MRLTKRKKYWHIIAIAIFTIVIFFLIQSPWRLFFGNITKPVYNLSLKIWEVFTPNKTLIAENKKLREDIKKLVVDYALLKDLELENVSLKNALNYKDNPHYEPVLAEVMGYIPGLEKNIILINKGENSGLQVDMPVITTDGILIGKVYRTDKYTSQIVLVESALFKTTAFIQNEKNSLGLVEGTRNLGIRINYLEQEDEIKIGDIVVTSGRDNFIPRGLVIGQITAIHKNEGDFFQSATITSPEKVQNIIFVNVLKPVYE